MNEQQERQERQEQQSLSFGALHSSHQKQTRPFDLTKPADIVR